MKRILAIMIAMVAVLLSAAPVLAQPTETAPLLYLPIVQTPPDYLWVHRGEMQQMIEAGDWLTTSPKYYMVLVSFTLPTGEARQLSRGQNDPELHAGWDCVHRGGDDYLYMFFVSPDMDTGEFGIDPESVWVAYNTKFPSDPAMICPGYSR